MTVLFADLSGYTAFAEGMDPEQVKSQVDRALLRLGHEVQRYGGTVDKYIGDNVMALFGAPVAHEDDAERAVRAGLGMQDAMAEINAGLPAGVDFELRVGVNTGEVLAGAVGEAYTVVGDTVNVASRLQSAARPGSVTVGERTMRSTDAAVSYEALEPLTLKGKAEPVPAWEAVGLIAEHSVRRVSPARESPLVGRQQELATLDSLYERVVRDGHPHLVTIVGEAGVGKSRLLREFEARLSQHPSKPTVRTGRCLPYGSGIVFWALGEVLREECGIVESDSSEEAWGKLRAYVGDLMGGVGKTSDREAALIGRLLGVDVPPELVPDEDDPERLRESFLAALRGGIEAIANRHPFVIAFEDIHWADDGLLDAIEHLAQWVRAPLMLVCLARDELLDRRGGWGGGRRSATQLFLDPLSDEHSRALVRALLPEGEEVVPAVAERSGGNPLFAEEMARRISEEGTHRGRRAAGHRPGRAGRPARLAGRVRAPAGAAGVGGGPHVPRGRAGDARDVGGARPGPRAHVAPGEGHPRPLHRRAAARRARARVQARPDPRRGVRDAAEGGPLAEALRGGRLPRGARRRPHRRERRAARRALRPRGGARPRERGPSAGARERCAGGRCISSRRPAMPRRSCTRTARRPRTTGTPARSLPRTGARMSCGSARSSETCRCGSVAWTRRSACGPTASTGTAARRTSSAWPTCTGASAPRSRTRASARPRSSITRRASTC